jgi:hypothetical protein
MTMTETQPLIHLCFLCCLLFKFSSLPFVEHFLAVVPKIVLVLGFFGGWSAGLPATRVASAALK